MIHDDSETERIVAGKYRDHVWHVDLTTSANRDVEANCVATSITSLHKASALTVCADGKIDI